VVRHRTVGGKGVIGQMNARGRQKNPKKKRRC
jgi:hypothetical protein